ncbi:MAG: 50S ribosomal protein L9 [Lachnospiraceae bacterium]|nr:50S ribosomal protein L9 [Lachnospiraceae bacterium]
MKVVLLQDLKSLGKKDAVVDVNDGYARNFLFPKKLAVEATKNNLNVLKQQKAAAARLAAEQLEAARQQAEELKTMKVSIPVKVGGSGKLFGAVSSKEIADALKDQCGLELDKKKIVLSEPIKTLGEKEVEIKLHKDVTAKLAVEIKELS